MEDMKSLINKIKFVAVEEFIADNREITGKPVKPAIRWIALVINLFIAWAQKGINE
jgi:hypothetical protein